MTSTGRHGGGRGRGRHGRGHGRGHFGRGHFNRGRFFRRGFGFGPSFGWPVQYQTFSPQWYWWAYLQQLAYLNQLQQQPMAGTDPNLVATIQELIEEINELQGVLAAHGIAVQPQRQMVVQQPAMQQPVFLQQQPVFQPAYFGPFGG